MPFYDLRCIECEKEFNISAKISEKTEKRIACPECGSFVIIVNECYYYYTIKKFSIFQEDKS